MCVPWAYTHQGPLLQGQARTLIQPQVSCTWTIPQHSAWFQQAILALASRESVMRMIRSSFLVHALENCSRGGTRQQYGRNLVLLKNSREIGRFLVDSSSKQNSLLQPCIDLPKRIIPMNTSYSVHNHSLHTISDH